MQHYTDKQMIYFLGDIHGDFEHVLRFALADRPTAVVFLGDIEAKRPFEQQVAPLLDAGIDVRWIRGNHDTDSMESWGHLENAMQYNIDGKVVELGGLRVAGLGGIFRGEIWYPHPRSTSGQDPKFYSHADYCHTQNERRPRRLRDSSSEKSVFARELKHQSSIFRADYERLCKQRADILVTHEAPGCHPNGFSAIDELARAMHVRASFHGHHHDSLDYRSFDDQYGFKAHGVGFCSIMDEAGRIVFPGKN